MTTKEYLGQILKINLMMENKLEDVARLRAMACRITVPTDGERVKSSPDPDKLTNVVAKIVEYEKGIEKDVDELIKIRKIIVKQIETLDNPAYYQVLNLQYVQLLQSKEIADKMGVSCAAMFNTKSEALVAFEEKFGEAYLTDSDYREKGKKKRKKEYAD